MPTVRAIVRDIGEGQLQVLVDRDGHRHERSVPEASGAVGYGPTRRPRSVEPQEHLEDTRNVHHEKHLSRRTVLRGLGISVGLPLLDAMVPAATALATTAAAPKPRIGFTYFPHGAIQARWQPKETGTAFELPQILKPFEPYQKHMTVDLRPA